jgi:hypothetical protein
MEEIPTSRYEIEFFRRRDGAEPVRRFLGSLGEDKRRSMVSALAFVLARQGLEVCRSEWGKAERSPPTADDRAGARLPEGVASRASTTFAR